MAPSITGLGDVGRFLHDGLARLVPDIPALAVRFPWPLVALLTTIVIVTFDDSSLARLIVHGPATQALQPIDNVVVALIGALLALTALALVAEGQGWSRGRLHAMSALACLALAALAVAAIWRWTWVLPNYPMLIAGSVLALATSTATAATSDRVNGRIVRGGALMAFAIFAAWLLVAFFQTVFGPGSLPAYQQMTHFSQIFVVALAPLLFLQWVPRTGDDSARGVPSGTGALLVDRIVVPLGLLAFAIATVALGAEAVRGPNAHHPVGVAPLVGGATALLALLTMTFLFVATLQDNRSPITGVLRRFYPVLALLPIGLFVYFAVIGWRTPARPSAHGHFQMDNDQYWTMGLPVVAVLVALLAIFRPVWRDLRLAVGAACAFLIVGSFGPWGEQAHNGRQARTHLAALLKEAGAFKDGQVTPGPIAITVPHINSQLTHWLNRLDRIDGLASIAPWFAGRADNPFNQPAAINRHAGVMAHLVQQSLGLNSPVVRPPTRPGATLVQINPAHQGAQIAAIPGYARMVGPIRIGGPFVPVVAPGGKATPHVQRISDTLIIEQAGETVRVMESLASPAGTRSTVIDLRPMLLKLVEVSRVRFVDEEARRKAQDAAVAGPPGAPSVPPRPPAAALNMHPSQVIEAEGGQAKVALLITQMTATLGPAPENALLSMQSGQAWLLLGPAPDPGSTGKP